MKQLTPKETQKVVGGVLPLLLLSDFAVGVTAGAALKKLWIRYF